MTTYINVFRRTHKYLFREGLLYQERGFCHSKSVLSKYFVSWRVRFRGLYCILTKCKSKKVIYVKITPCLRLEQKLKIISTAAVSSSPTGHRSWWEVWGVWDNRQSGPCMGRCIAWCMVWWCGDDVVGVEEMHDWWGWTWTLGEVWFGDGEEVFYANVMQ